MKSVIEYQKLIIIFLISHIFIVDATAKQGDQLFINARLVNMRAQPEKDAEVLLKLKRDRKVTEVQRKGNWVEIETHRDDVKTGWVHNSLLSKIVTTKNTASPTRFDKFMQRFDNHNETINKQNGIIYFSDAKNKGKGDIYLIATDAWINSNIQVRNNSLSEVFNFWSDVVPVGSSISIHVIDNKGEQYTVMLR